MTCLLTGNRENKFISFFPPSLPDSPHMVALAGDTFFWVGYVMYPTLLGSWGIRYNVALGDVLGGEGYP